MTGNGKRFRRIVASFCICILTSTAALISVGVKAASAQEIPADQFEACDSIESARAQRELIDDFARGRLLLSPNTIRPVANGCARELMIVSLPITKELSITAVKASNGATLCFYHATITFKSGPLNGQSGNALVAISDEYIAYLKNNGIIAR
jgi:hypothetical protein